MFHRLTQQLSTTLRVPLGQPVLVGGMTSDPSQADSSRLYLIVEATAGDAVDDLKQSGRMIVPTPMPLQPRTDTPRFPSKK